MENQPKPQRIHKYKITIDSDDLYKFYTDELNKETKLKSAVLKKDFSKIRKRLGELISNYLINDFGEWILPYGFGSISIVRNGLLAQYREEINDKNIYKLNPDWGETNKLWKEKPELKGQLVYLENDHTLGYRYKLKWTKPKLPTIIHKTLYKLKPCRTLNRKLNEKLKTTPFQQINYNVLKSYNNKNNN